MRWLAAGLLCLSVSVPASDLSSTRQGDLTLYVAQEANAARAQAGLMPAALDSGLSRVAFSHSVSMGTRSFWGHVDPDGRTPRLRVLEAYRDFRGAVAENLWRCSGCGQLTSEEVARRAVRAWLESPGHRQNLLHPQVTHCGIGVWAEGDSVYVTQVLAIFAGSARR